jgi:hypothetical protein
MSGADMREIVSQNANMPFLPKPFHFHDGGAPGGAGGLARLPHRY